MKTTFEFIGMFCAGWFGAFVLLLALKNEFPQQDAQFEKQVNSKMKRLMLNSGLIVAFAWLLYHWTPAFGD
jgi:hypothetical protein